MAVVGFILLWFGALGLGAMIGLGAFAAVRAFGPPALLLAWVVIAAAWLVGPLVAAALDETLEPRRLELLPLPPLRLVTGLLAAAAIGPGALATAVVVCLSLL
ncbi:MAG: transporter, partial [Acidimicrobiia bacterium]